MNETVFMVETWKTVFDEPETTWGSLPEVQQRVNDFFEGKDGESLKEVPCYYCGHPLREEAYRWAAPPEGVFFTHKRCIPEE